MIKEKKFSAPIFIGPDKQPLFEWYTCLSTGIGSRKYCELSLIKFIRFI